MFATIPYGLVAFGLLAAASAPTTATDLPVAIATTFSPLARLAVGNAAVAVAARHEAVAVTIEAWPLN
jgi:hypothetical protein